MLKHMLNANGNVARSSRPDSSMVMEPRHSHDVSHRYRTPGGVGSIGGGVPNTLANNASALRTQYPLSVTHLPNLDTSKHSIYAKAANGGLNISRPRPPGPVNKFIAKSKQVGVKEMLVSLGLLCLVSLLLALLSLIFLLKISPVTASDIRDLLRAEQLTVITAEEYVVVYEVTLALCALTLSLNLCCLLVCAIQFLFAVKLVKSPHGGSERTNKYLQKSSVSRVCAVGGFFISIPVFLTGIILYTFIQFHSTPAIVTSVFIGLGIVFCGCAMVHNVFIWQREKTNAVKELALQQANTHNSFHNISAPGTAPHLNHLNQSHASHLSNYSVGFLHSTAHGSPPATILANGPYILRPATTTPPTTENLKFSHPREASGSVSPGMHAPTLDLSSVATTNSPHELSTLV